MPRPYYDGKPLDALELENDIFSLLRLLRDKIKSLIPIGGGIVFTFLNNKIFNLRPQVFNSTYSSITKNNNKQTEKLVQWLGSPLTLDLLDQLEVVKKYDESLESSAGEDFSQFYSFDGSSSEYKKEDVLPLNPNSDKVFDSMPMKGNSPFIFNGYLGFSNFVQDTNIRIYPNENGTELKVKGKRITAFIPAQSSTDFIVTNDTVIGEPDRKELEAIHLDNINISVTSNTVFNETAPTSGHFPALNLGKDVGVWLVHDNFANKTSVILTDWSNPYITLNGVVRYPHPTWLSGITSNYKYFRCLGCVFVNSDGLFESSKSLAWGEKATNLNGSPEFTELFQQNSEANFTTKNSTNPDDRRIIPSFYYLYQKNPSVQSLVNYKGLIRKAPGAGANLAEVLIDSPVQNSNPSCTFKLNSVELTNGSESFWLSNFNLSLASLNPITNLGQTSMDTGTFIFGENYYLWIVADPKSIIDLSNNAPDNNLKIKFLLSKSDSWRNVANGWKGANPRYTLRCRLGWIRTSAANSEVIPFYMKDGNYSYFNLPGASNSGAGSVYEFSDNATLISGTNTTSGWTELNSNTKLPVNTNGDILAKAIGGRLAITTGSASTVDSKLGISSPGYGATIGSSPNWAFPFTYGTGAQGMIGVLQSNKNGKNIRTNMQSRYHMYLNNENKVYYAADLSSDSGNPGTKWFITLDELLLPINGGFCYL